MIAKKVNKKVEFDYWTGCPNDVIGSINRAISQYLIYYKKVKVGITGRNPQERFNEHQNNGRWNRMVVKYKTSSENFANKVEKYFIETRPELKNKWLGYSGLSENGYNYLYVIMK
jgi:hypothetical protein